MQEKATQEDEMWNLLFSGNGEQMNKKALKKYLMKNATDFLNYENGTYIGGIRFKGFYIEVDDIVELMAKRLKK